MERPTPPRDPLEPSSRATPVTLAVIALIELLVFLFDVREPPGSVEWTLYFLPVVACLFARLAWLPLATASVSTALLAVGFHLSPPGPIDEIGKVNREIGGAVIWIVALLAWRFIGARNRVQDDRSLEQGQRLLAETIRSERDQREIAARAVSEACRRVGAVAGALFVKHNGSPYALVGGFGLSPTRLEAAPAFALGEGLVGAAAREGRVLRVSDVPAGYADLASGTGSAPPRHLLLAPLTASDETTGVLELAFTTSPPTLAAAYLERIGPPLGAALQTAHYQEHLRVLLGEARLRAEELKAQREALSVANRDLEHHAKALQESQQKLEEQQTELEQSNQQLEEQRAELEQSNQQLEEQAEALRSQQTLIENRNAELIRARHELEAKAEQLELASRYKSEFLANMSHELRTPLNSALILARLLAENKAGNLSAEQAQYAETIHGAGVDLLNLINDVLDLAKVEAGKMDVSPSSFTLGTFADAIERAFRPVAEASGIAFGIALEARDAKIHTDRTRLDQIVRNLLSNAFKFTERGEVALEIAVTDDRVSFRVRDTGIGIADDQLERIFEAFGQVEEVARRKLGGTGLGLSIARRLALLMGGDVRVESEVGRGSTFTLELPRVAPNGRRPAAATAIAVELRPPESVTRPALATVGSLAHSAPSHLRDDRDALDGSRPTILVVEDDERFAFVLLELAHELGLRCLVATTGAEGIALCREHRPDAVILDVKLPDRSGLSVLDELKRSPRTCHIPVHVLSILDCMQTAREMGAVSYMLKPAKREEIVRALSDVAARAKRSERRVLVVEDNATQRDAIQALVRQDGVEIVGVRSAGEALRELDERKFDCVILDLGLPDISGFELLEQMANGERFVHPPVIVYTGRGLSREDEDRLQRYARTIVLKGARSPERLLQEVTLFLHRAVDELPPDQQRLLADLGTRDRALDGRTVLLVDDDVRNVYALTSLLEAQHARVRIARDGEEALRALERDRDVDLVLMDVMMPVMDGYEATRRIRADERFAGLPIIALTARAMPDDYERCLDAGADDYLSKPVDFDRLVALLRVWIGRRRPLLR